MVFLFSYGFFVRRGRTGHMIMTNILEDFSAFYRRCRPLNLVLTIVPSFNYVLTRTMYSTVDDFTAIKMNAKLGNLLTIGSLTMKNWACAKSVHRRINNTDMRRTVKPF